jgi:hypothetical protein
MRKAIKFYRSYWEMGKELSDSDRLAFYDAILKRQFTGEETDLKGLSKFAYISQKHSIDSQVDGYLAQWNKTYPNKDPWQGGVQGGMEAPTIQEEEKVEEKGKVQEEEKVEVQVKVQPQRQPKLDINGYVIMEEDESKS